MRYIIAVTVAVILSLTRVAAQADSPFKVLEGSGFPHGSEIGVLVSAPKGWILDAESGQEGHLAAVMYPAGVSWENSDDFIYFNFFSDKPENSLDSFIDTDLAPFKASSSTFEVSKGSPIALSSGESAEVRLLTGEKNGRYEAVAYVKKLSNVAMIVLSCKTKASFENYIGVFREMIAKGVMAQVKYEKK
jgi:hypothetical protein